MYGKLATIMQAYRSQDPTWTPKRLRRLVDGLADRPDFWPHEVEKSSGGRLYQLAYRDEDVEVWVIYWSQDSRTEMHDHGGSVGAMAVVDGALTEIRAVPGGISQRDLHAGESTAFPQSYIHDVINQQPSPARSVHAYSPPISQMTYYALTNGVPVAVRREDVREGVPA